jgi:preprotein translocase subunit SecG
MVVYTAFLVIHVAIILLLIAVILLQKSSDDGVNDMSSSPLGRQKFVSGGSSKIFLTRFTAVLAALFMINCLVLSNLSSRSASKSITEEIIKQVSSDEIEVPNIVNMTDLGDNNEDLNNSKEKTVTKNGKKTK